MNKYIVLQKTDGNTWNVPAEVWDRLIAYYLRGQSIIQTESQAYTYELQRLKGSFNLRLKIRREHNSNVFSYDMSLYEFAEHSDDKRLDKFMLDSVIVEHDERHEIAVERDAFLFDNDGEHMMIERDNLVELFKGLYQRYDKFGGKYHRTKVAISTRRNKNETQLVEIEARIGLSDEVIIFVSTASLLVDSPAKHLLYIDTLPDSEARRLAKRLGVMPDESLIYIYDNHDFLKSLAGQIDATIRDDNNAIEIVGNGHVLRIKGIDAARLLGEQLGDDFFEIKEALVEHIAKSYKDEQGMRFLDPYKVELVRISSYPVVSDDAIARAKTIELSDAQEGLLLKFERRFEDFARTLALTVSMGATLQRQAGTKPIGFSQFDIEYRKVCKDKRTFEKLLELELVELIPDSVERVYRITELGLAVAREPIPVYEVNLPKFKYRDVLKSSLTQQLYRVTRIAYDVESRLHTYTLAGFGGNKVVKSDDSRLDSLGVASQDYLDTLDAML